MTRRTGSRRRPHPFTAAAHPNWRGDAVCGHNDCGQVAAAAVHQLPANPAADEEARRLGEHPEREDHP